MSRGPGHVMRAVAEMLGTLDDTGLDVVDYYVLAYGVFGTYEPNRSELSSIERAVGALVAEGRAQRITNVGRLVGLDARRTFVRPLSARERARQRQDVLVELFQEPDFFDRLFDPSTAAEYHALLEELHALLASGASEERASASEIRLAMRMPNGKLQRAVIALP